jgi:3-hydroxyisobutyrate dehydrogenase-like beta-hydroxyacid dehydrogenase
VCLLVYDTVHEALAPAREALSGRTLVNLTNGTPEQARAMSQWAVTHGANYVDGGIMAVPPMIGRQHALILYSGSRQGFDTNSRQLDALGTSKYLGEDAGLAPLYDISLLAGMYGLFGGVLQALALTGSAGIPAGEFMPLLMSWLQAMQGGLPKWAEQIDAGDHKQCRLQSRHAGRGLCQSDRCQQGRRHQHRTRAADAKPDEARRGRRQG